MPDEKAPAEQPGGEKRGIVAEALQYTAEAVVIADYLGIKPLRPGSGGSGPADAQDTTPPPPQSEQPPQSDPPSGGDPD